MPVTKMNKAKNKLILYAVAVVFVLLTLLVGIINVINFTMAANDADTITEALADQRGIFQGDFGGPMDDGSFNNDFFMGGDRKMGPMGPSSPEMQESVRYFTVAFNDKKGTAEVVAYQIDRKSVV